MKACQALWRSFQYASQGMTWALRTQRNMRIHFSIAFLAMLLCLLFDLSRIEIILVFFAIVGVISAELFNTAVEAVVDLVTSEYQMLAKIAKDVAAAAVLLSTLHAVIVSFFVFFDKLFPLRLRHLRDLSTYSVFLAFVGLGILMLLIFSGKAWLAKKA
ncbi:MAG: hypothetical protein JWN30_2375 [Bacilli bacterium]|nr:hypothetical protein [Bacilli bacterium]